MQSLTVGEHGSSDQQALNKQEDHALGQMVDAGSIHDDGIRAEAFHSCRSCGVVSAISWLFPGCTLALQQLRHVGLHKGNFTHWQAHNDTRTCAPDPRGGVMGVHEEQCKNCIPTYIDNNQKKLMKK